MKNIFHLLELRMQVTDLSLDPLVSIEIDAVDKSRPGASNCILYTRTQQVDLPEALGPEQVVDVLVTTGIVFCMVDGDMVCPSTNFPKLHFDMQQLRCQCLMTPSLKFVPTLVSAWLCLHPFACSGCSGIGPYSYYQKVEVVVASKKYLAFTWDVPSVIYESFQPLVLKVR